MTRRTPAAHRRYWLHVAGQLALALVAAALIGHAAAILVHNARAAQAEWEALR